VVQFGKRLKVLLWSTDCITKSKDGGARLHKRTLITMNKQASLNDYEFTVQSSNIPQYTFLI